MEDLDGGPASGDSQTGHNCSPEKLQFFPGGQGREMPAGLQAPLHPSLPLAGRKAHRAWEHPECVCLRVCVHA